MEMAWMCSIFGISDQGHGQSGNLKFFTIYKNTNCRSHISALVHGKSYT